MLVLWVFLWLVVVIAKDEWELIGIARISKLLNRKSNFSVMALTHLLAITDLCLIPANLIF